MKPEASFYIPVGQLRASPPSLKTISLLRDEWRQTGRDLELPKRKPPPCANIISTSETKRSKGVKRIRCFYDSSAQLESVFLPCLEEGLRKGEQVVCIFPEGQHANLKSKLDARGAGVAEAEARDQFQVLTEDDTYLTGGSEIPTTCRPRNFLGTLPGAVQAPSKSAPRRARDVRSGDVSRR